MQQQYRSRLRNKVRNTLYKNTFVSIAAFAVILIIVVFFGLQLLVKFSLLIGKIKSINEAPSTNSQSEFVLTPTLNPILEATNSAKLDISGIGSTPGQTIELYVNDEKQDDTVVDNNSQFNFSGITLGLGENLIKVKAKEKEKESQFSPTAKIVYETTPPALEIKQPTDGQTINKKAEVVVMGKTDAEASISVNDFLPIVDSSGNFSYTLPLKEGENIIKIIAKDKAGNETSNEIKVTYQP